MDICNNNYSKIELVDGDFIYHLNDGTIKHIFLYKYRGLENCIDAESVFNTDFNYDLVVLDNQCKSYLYFTFNYKGEPTEVVY